MTTKMTKEQKDRIKLETKIAKIIEQCCKNKPRDIKPRKWAINKDNEVELVFKAWYYEDKKLMRLLDKIIDKINEKLNLEVTYCADTTENLDWHWV